MPKAGSRDICVRFGLAVRRRREELGWTQEELAARARINRSYIGDVERGTRNVALRNLDKIATALKVPLVQLLQEGPR